MPSSHQFYHTHSELLSEQYNSLAFEQVHTAWRKFWPCSGDTVLDVGAGSGRDAKWMASQGCEVIALEPANALRELGKQHTGDVVTWVNDELPALNQIVALGIKFDVILLSAVWMHIPLSERERAFRKLSNLLAPNGRMIISLRHGEFDDGRVAYPVSSEEIAQLAKNTALRVDQLGSSPDALNRAGITWQTIVLHLPDDGSGDLTKVRHIIVNDSKSATYKLALLRTILRIADAHFGCVIDRQDGKVSIPLGLVALYWIRQYKRLLDTDDLQQSSNANKGLGFVKPEGWGKLQHLTADDLSIGALFIGEEATGLDCAIRDSIKVMKEGPVKFTYQGERSNPYFAMVSGARKQRVVNNTLRLDSELLQSYGQFVLDESLWDCFRLYHPWIEPLVVNQWVMEMKRFKRNRERNLSLDTYHAGLAWVNEKHDTKLVRSRVDDLRQQGEKIVSVWSGKGLKAEYHVDHCLPFAHWPCNDKWNLLPATKQENSNKSDRLPSSALFHQSSQRILQWWQMAWGQDSELAERFFCEAALSLPNISAQCRDFEEVLDAMGLQIHGVKSRLQLNDWSL